RQALVRASACRSLAGSVPRTRGRELRRFGRLGGRHEPAGSPVPRAAVGAAAPHAPAPRSRPDSLPGEATLLPATLPRSAYTRRRCAARRPGAARSRCGRCRSWDSLGHEPEQGGTASTRRYSAKRPGALHAVLGLLAWLFQALADQAQAALYGGQRAAELPRD